MLFNTIDLTPQDCYRLMVGAIIPRPIAWISTQNSRGVLNLAPYSFFTVASCNPPVLSVTQTNPRDRAVKDTLSNLKETGECVINIVTASMAEQMNATCANYPYGVSEFEAVGVEQIKSFSVNTPGVSTAPVRFECRLRELVEISKNPSGGILMLLDVISIFATDSILSSSGISANLLDAIGKIGGDGYATTRHVFELARPVYEVSKTG